MPPVTPDDIPGWLHDGEGEALAAYATSRPGLWVEIGSYCGKSTLHLAAAAEATGSLLFTVDPHRGNPEMAPGQDCHHPEVWAREHGSLSVLVDTVAGHRSHVVPVVGTGDQFAATGIRPGLVFIDAFHQYEGVRGDFDRWGPLVADGGLLTFHDAALPHWGPGIVVGEAQREGWRLVEQVCCLAVLERA